MAPPKKPDADKCDYQKNIRGTKAEVEAWEQAAKLSNMTFSQWARLVLTKCAIEEVMRENLKHNLGAPGTQTLAKDSHR